MMATIERFNADDLNNRMPDLIELLRNVVDGGASVNFVAPLDTAVAADYWSKVARGIADGERIVLAACVDGGLAGSVQLVMATQPNGLHRAEVQKLIVHSQYRGQGIARQLMSAIEAIAQEAGRTLLVLDTERGSAGETVYEKLGYTRAGIIPQFALNFNGSQLIDTVVFYKLLAV